MVNKMKSKLIFSGLFLISSASYGMPITFDVVIGEFHAPRTQDLIVGTIKIDVGEYMYTETVGWHPVRGGPAEADIYHANDILDWNVTVDNINFAPDNSMGGLAGNNPRLYHYSDYDTYLGIGVFWAEHVDPILNCQTNTTIVCDWTLGIQEDDRTLFAHTPSGFTHVGSYLRVRDVPEPGALALISIGLLGLLINMKRHEC